MEFAEQLFQFWDEDKLGSIPLDVIVRDMLSIGLAPSQDLLLRMISIVLKQPASALASYRVTAKDLQKMCQSSRLVNRLLRILNESVKQQSQA